MALHDELAGVRECSGPARELPSLAAACYVYDIQGLLQLKAGISVASEPGDVIFLIARMLALLRATQLVNTTRVGLRSSLHPALCARPCLDHPVVAGGQNAAVTSGTSMHAARCLPALIAAPMLLCTFPCTCLTPSLAPMAAFATMPALAAPAKIKVDNPVVDLDGDEMTR